MLNLILDLVEGLNMVEYAIKVVNLRHSGLFGAN